VFPQEWNIVVADGNSTIVSSHLRHQLSKIKTSLEKKKEKNIKFVAAGDKR
jgi:hypothetical protein